MSLCVVDSSVAFKWYRQRGDEDCVLEATTLLERHLSGELELHVPDLLMYEIGNILKFKGDLISGSALSVLRNTFLLEIKIHPINPQLAEAAFRFARKYAITFYDASFLALSRLLTCSFITADKKLYVKIKSLPKVGLLGNK